MIGRVLLALVALAAIAAPEAQAYRSKAVFIASRQSRLPLDAFVAPTRVYALRRERASYATNKLVRLLRASDSTETDIGFTSRGAIDVATAASFCAGTTCTCKTLYDQSGNAANMTEATAANQPTFTFNSLGAQPSCVLSALTVVLNAAANYTPSTGVLSMAAVSNRAVGTGNCKWRPSGDSNTLGPRGSNANQWLVVGASSNLVLTANDAAWHAGLAIVNGASTAGVIDGTTTAGATVGSTTAGLPGLVGAASTTCNYVEVAVWDNYALTTREQTLLHNNQRAYWRF